MRVPTLLRSSYDWPMVEPLEGRRVLQLAACRIDPIDTPTTPALEVKAPLVEWAENMDVSIPDHSIIFFSQCPIVSGLARLQVHLTAKNRGVRTVMSCGWKLAVLSSYSLRVLTGRIATSSGKLAKRHLLRRATSSCLIEAQNDGPDPFPWYVQNLKSSAAKSEEQSAFAKANNIANL